MSRLVCACGTPIPANRAGRDHCSEQCETAAAERQRDEELHQLAEGDPRGIREEWMQAWRERIDREAVTAVIGLNPATVVRLSKPDPYDDFRVRVHFIDGSHTDYELTVDQFRAAVQYTNDAYCRMIYGSR
jgi:hypothetical protein